MRDTVNNRPPHQLSDRFHVDSRRLQQLLANTPLQQYRFVAKFILVQQYPPRQAEPVRMNTRASHANQSIPCDDSVPQNQIPLPAEAGREPDKIEPFAFRKQFRHNSRLSSNNRHTGLLRAFDKADSYLVNDRAVRPTHRHIVEEADGLRACADQIISAHCHTVNPDSVILLHHLGDQNLRPDAVRMETQDPAMAQIHQSSVVAYRKEGPSYFASARLEAGL